MLIFVLAIYALLGFLEITPMVKEGERVDLVLYLILFSSAFIMSILLSLGIELPKPEYTIMRIVESIIGEQ